jgi:large subunit ribosomal protein L18
VPFRRRRTGRTDYRRRLKLLKAGVPRAVVRKSNRHTRVQFAEALPEGDRIVASAISSELQKFGWKHSTSATPAAYLTGFLAGRRALDAGIKSAVLDIGLHVPSKGAKVFATLKGIVDAGVQINHGEEVIPSPERLSGEFLGEAVAKDFEAVKGKIGGESDE